MGLRGSKNRNELGVGSRLVSNRIADFYTRAVREHARGRLLDLGCGKAPLLGYYAQFVENSTLVDWGNSMHENPILDLVADLNEPLALSDEAFDTVILSDVLEHIAEPQALLREISRVLSSDGGVLLLNVPFFYPIHEEPFDYYRYTEFSLARMCSSVGLQVREIAPLGGLPEILIDLFGKILQRMPFIGPSVAAVIQTTGEWITGRGLGKFASDRSAKHFPLGYTLIAVKQSDSLGHQEVDNSALPIDTKPA